MKLTVALVALAAALFQQVHADKYCCVSTSEKSTSCGDEGTRYCVQLATAGTKKLAQVCETNPFRTRHYWTDSWLHEPCGPKENGRSLGEWACVGDPI
ncbi:hypothetical protein WAI453_002776 [Rhynchosporium graminicola]